MKKWQLGIILGGILGIFDGLTAPLSAPETAPELGGIVVGSVIKGIIAGAIIGFFAHKVVSVKLGIIFGLVVGALLAFGVALMQYIGLGRVYFWQIMLPGAVVGLIVGYVTQTHGQRAATKGEQL